MTEKIEDIAKKIKRHRDEEIRLRVTNNAIARSLAIYNNVEQQFWLINSENLMGFPLRDLNNNVIGWESRGSAIKSDGHPIYKNQKLGEILIKHHEGLHQISAPGGVFNLEILNRATYKPSLSYHEFASDILIRIAEDEKKYSFRNIIEILAIQTEIDKVKEQLETATIEEAELLVKRIHAKEVEKKSYLDKAQSFIRKYAELRYQPILDPLQEAIKRSKIFDGVLIINGGPGTGKTTLLIQRIKFLISSSIEEYKQLTQSQKDILLVKEQVGCFSHQVIYLRIT